MKGFPHTIDNSCSISYCREYIKSLVFSSKCKMFFCNDCEGLESLNGLNCEKFYGNSLDLQLFGTTFNAKFFEFDNFPTPTADEMRRFIQLNPEFDTEQQAPWIKLIKDYFEHKDIFRVAQEFEALYCKNVLSVYSTHYNEPLLKQNNTIEISQNSSFDLSL